MFGKVGVWEQIELQGGVVERRKSNGKRREDEEDQFQNRKSRSLNVPRFVSRKSVNRDGDEF